MLLREQSGGHGSIGECTSDSQQSVVELPSVGRHSVTVNMDDIRVCLSPPFSMALKLAKYVFSGYDLCVSVSIRVWE